MRMSYPTAINTNIACLYMNGAVAGWDEYRHSEWRWLAYASCALSMYLIVLNCQRMQFWKRIGEEVD